MDRTDLLDLQDAVAVAAANIPGDIRKDAQKGHRGNIYDIARQIDDAWETLEFMLNS